MQALLSLQAHLACIFSTLKLLLARVEQHALEGATPPRLFQVWQLLYTQQSPCQQPAESACTLGATDGSCSQQGAMPCFPWLLDSRQQGSVHAFHARGLCEGLWQHDARQVIDMQHSI